ncbi:MAG TPA: hypothetical protein VNA23_08010 [Anaerolineales bacterium]|nr:hypothetical protein [Anaerolineales bacterium]
MSGLRKPVLVIILVLSIVIGSSQLTRGHEWGDDFAAYIMQAKSILNGDMRNFVEHNSITIHQSSAHIGPVAYPWGYPLILMPVYAAKGISPLALKLPGLFFFAGFLICIYMWMKNRFTRSERLLFVSLFAFNPLLLNFLDQILSDIPFLFLSTLALLLMMKKKPHSTLNAALLGAVIAFAFFIRTTGILLLTSFLVVEFFKIWSNQTTRESNIKTLQDAVVVCATFGGLWIVYSLIFPGGSESYFDQLEGFTVKTALRSTSAYFQLFSLFFGTSMVWRYLYYVLFIFFLVGAWMRRKEDTILIVFFLLWMLLLVIWPSWQGPRFIFPLLPVFIYFIFQGMRAVISKLPANYHQQGKWIFYGVWLSIIGIFLFNSIMDAYTNLQNNRSINGPFDLYSMEVYDFVKEKTPADSVIIFFKPRAMRLLTDRDTLMSTECERMFLGNYIVLSRKVEENQQIAPEQINACNLRLDEALRNRRFIVYEILK